ncbi:hypothetical protein SAMN05216327_101568 [Dyadobacter sp. SG02]|uniref:hypothetical protein n=1 Tax=Dyadobacter sp. SG02 TaxID=1855291 RepID=UPI0008C63382|nr:hypothetical protein [Dyadobacter sp. SG02]SEI43800.1 hypothetical protein SAMN05216327_101568 [Dyadobacter sp. SG02]
MSEFKIPGMQLVPDNAALRKYLTKSPRHVLVLSVVLVYLALESYYLFFRFHAHTQDLALYHRIAAKIWDGQIPFRDFRVEYPIFALIPILLPGLLSQLAGGSFESYVCWFVLQNLALGAGMAWTIAQSDASGKALPRFLIGMLLFLPIFLFRFDPFPAMLTTFAIAYVSGKPFVSGMSLMASIVAKLYSIVLVPVFGLYYLFSRDFRKLFWVALGACCTLVITLGCIAFARMEAASDFMHYHLLRGIQIESLSGGILLLLEQTGLLELEVAQNFGAMHLETSLSGLVLQMINISTPVCFLAMAVFLGRSFYRISRSGNITFRQLNAAAAAQILLFILLNKVLSPQYLIWLLPLIPFCRFRASLIFTAALMLTVLIFPGHYYNLISKQLLMVVILNIRNGLLIWLFIQVVSDVTRDRVRS